MYKNPLINTTTTFQRIIQGDCIRVLKTLQENSIDCVVTDPPYGIGFMGKDWDKSLPPKEAFEECFRVLKPGALAFVMSSPRQDVLWRMMAMLEEAGFELKQSFISWIYKSGFPKSYDVSKGIDKKLRLKREIIGVKNNPRYHYGYEHSLKGEMMGHKYGVFKEVDGSKVGEISDPASDLAKKWDGWKSIAGLKPALECILMVNKPLSEKTIIDNVLKWGTGAINVDATRIPFQSNNDFENRKRGVLKSPPLGRNKIYGDMQEVNTDKYLTKKGRFPANLIISDNALDDGRITKSPSGKVRRQRNMGRTWSKDTCGLRSKPSDLAGYGDIGSPYRYFDLDAWFKHQGFLDVPKASKGERDKGLEELPFGIVEALHGSVDGSLNKRTKGSPSFAKNIHPTVKPIRLMAYLIELGCPPNGVVLDPFLGPGTTMLASLKLHRSCIGIEIDPETCQIAKARIFPKDKILGGIKYEFQVFPSP